MEKKSSTTKMMIDEANLKVMCMGNNYYAPCTSPFSLKLQTYLRMAGIKYEVVSCVMSSSKGKVPYIQYSDQQVEDTTNILNFLNKQFGMNLNSNLNAEEAEKANGFQKTIEESLHWCLEYQRWNQDENILETFPLTNWFFRFIFNLMLKCKIRPELQQELNERNMGACSPEELKLIAEKNLTALSQYLEDKPFFMGKEPSEIDATVFGFVGLLLNGMENSNSGQFVRTSLPNLIAYVERMKNMYWPDWDELCSPRDNSKANKGCCASKQKRACSPKGVKNLA